MLRAQFDNERSRAASDHEEIAVCKACGLYAYASDGLAGLRHCNSRGCAHSAIGQARGASRARPEEQAWMRSKGQAIHFGCVYGPVYAVGLSDRYGRRTGRRGRKSAEWSRAESSRSLAKPTTRRLSHPRPLARSLWRVFASAQSRARHSSPRYTRSRRPPRVARLLFLSSKRAGSVGRSLFRTHSPWCPVRGCSRTLWYSPARSPQGRPADLRHPRVAG